MPQKSILYHDDWIGSLVAWDKKGRRPLPVSTIRSDAWIPVKTTHLCTCGTALASAALACASNS